MVAMAITRPTQSPLSHSLTPPLTKSLSLLPATTPRRLLSLPSAINFAAITTTPATWSPSSWRSKTASQLPDYPNEDDLNSVLETLSSFPPIVFAGEARKLEERLAQAALGNAFLMQGGDCAESFKEFNANNIRDTFRVLLQMSVVLMFGGQMPVVKVALFNFLIAVSGKCKNPQQATRVFDEMKRCDVKPAGQAFICLLNVPMMEN